MKFFRTLSLGALVLGFSLSLAATESYAQRSRYWGDSYRSSGYYGAQYRQRSWRSGYGSGLTWRQRQRLRAIRYRMIQRNHYYNRMRWAEQRRWANRRNYYRRNSYYGNSYYRNW